jgi:hypothetical protein
LRGLGSLRQDFQDRFRNRVDLRDRRADIRTRIEVNLHDSESVYRFGFEMLDPIDGGRVGALADQHHPPLDVERRQPGVIPHHHHDRQVDGGKDVHVHPRERQYPEH